MSEFFDLACAISRSNAAVAMANHADLKALRSRVHELETALNRMALAHENTESDSEGHYPLPDTGCIECTRGTVPNNLNTGLCAYHNAKRLLGQ